MNIYVGNLSRTVTEDALRKLFEGFGTVVSVKIMSDKFTGEPRGFGFLTMDNDAEAEAAIEGLNNYELDGQRLRVNVARPPQPRENRMGGMRSEGGSQGPRRSFGGPRSGSSSSSTGGFRSRNRY